MDLVKIDTILQSYITGVPTIAFHVLNIERVLKIYDAMILQIIYGHLDIEVVFRSRIVSFIKTRVLKDPYCIAMTLESIITASVMSSSLRSITLPAHTTHLYENLGNIC